MTTQTMFAARPYAGAADLQAVCDLLNACDAVDHLDDNYAVEDLRGQLADPRLDPAYDLRIWEDAAGRPAGWGKLGTAPNLEAVQDAGLHMRVHPDYRQYNLESAILAWAEARAREVGQARRKPVRLRAGSKDFDTRTLDLLARHGFAPNRYFFQMACPLDAPIPAPQFPAGYTLRACREDELAEWVACFNESFIDHWNHHPTTVEQRQNWLDHRAYRRERDLVAIAPDGRIAAFCFCWIDPAYNARNGRNEGWIEVLGTRRGYRKIGLGRAMLLAGLQRLQADGVNPAVLGVDAENPTGALRLYESAGFVKESTWVNMAKDL